MILQVDSCETIPEFINYTKCNPVSIENGFLVSIQSSSLMLWIEDSKVVLDTGHRLPITTVCVSASSNPYLCSCSDDKVILWSLEDFSSNCSGSSKNGLLVGVDLGCISDCSISCDNSWLALCRECDMWIVQLQHTSGVLCAVSHHATIETPGETPSFCVFSPRVPSLLVTADDSNVFKVWDTELGHVVHRASVGAWHRVSFCEFVLCGSHRGHLLVGSNRGVLHLFSVSLNKPPRDLGHVTATPPLHSSVSLTAEDLDAETKAGNDSYWSISNRRPVSPPVEPSDGCGAGSVILGALLLDAYPERPEALEEAELAAEQGGLRPDDADPVVDGILAAAPLLAVCSNLGVAVYDCNTWACLDFRPYADLLGCEPSLVSTATLSGRSPGRIDCLVGALVGCGPRTHLLHLACSPREPRPHASGVSFLNLSTLSARSPLRAQFTKPAVDGVVAAYGKAADASSSSRSSSRRGPPPPRAVRSSGYGPTPGAAQRQMFVPVTSKQHARRPPVLPEAGLWGGNGGSLPSPVDGDLMRRWRPPLRQCAKVSLWDDFGAAVRLAASGDGCSLACSCGPGVVSVLRWAKPGVDDGVRITGHDARITSLDFGLDSRWLMSSSGDGSTKVWDWRERRCLLDIGPDDGAPTAGPRRGGGAGRTKAEQGPPPPRGAAVAQAAFFYMDRFILRAVANHVDLYCHRLQERLEAGGPPRIGGPGASRGWRRVRRIDFPTQQVTCFAAPNTFYSNVLVVGCASRSLHVYDVDAERFLAEVRDAHPRPPHTLALATASAAAPQSGRAVDLLVSAAACDGAKLWDLRQARCVQKYSRHSNRAHSCGVALSPCCRYLAVGSEDKSVYLYDTRRSSDYVDKMLGLNDVVVDVVWNPRKPQLAASALNSCVAVYESV